MAARRTRRAAGPDASGGGGGGSSSAARAAAIAEQLRLECSILLELYVSTLSYFIQGMSGHANL